MPHASPPRIAHLLVRCAIRYCVRFHTFLYSRKLIVIRARSSGLHASVNEARTPRVLRGFSPHRVADVDIITGCCERIARRGGPPRFLAAPHVGAILVASRRADLQPLHRCDRAHDSRNDRGVSVTAHALRASCPRPVGCARTARISTVRLVGDVAVKNLRIATSTVLLLNFSEVSALHLCSTGVTM